MDVAGIDLDDEADVDPAQGEDAVDWKKSQASIVEA
jgi:hypothetical protein